MFSLVFNPWDLYYWGTKNNNSNTSTNFYDAITMVQPLHANVHLICIA